MTPFISGGKSKQVLAKIVIQQINSQLIVSGDILGPDPSVR